MGKLFEKYDTPPIAAKWKESSFCLIIEPQVQFYLY